jgi:hypothetical protein
MLKPGALLQQLLCLAIASETDKLQFHNSIELSGFVQYWEVRTAGPERLCRGTLLSRQQYLVDVQEWGFRDARLEERVQMNEKNIADWTDAIEKEE